MSQSNFKQFFLNQILDFLWRQWSALGVAGGGRSEDVWLIDPEPTFIFSITMARYEPRLFDEILDWFVINGKWIDSQRMRTLVKNENEISFSREGGNPGGPALFGAAGVRQFVAKRAP